MANIGEKGSLAGGFNVNITCTGAPNNLRCLDKRNLNVVMKAQEDPLFTRAFDSPEQRSNKEFKLTP